VKVERQAILMGVQQDISAEKNQQLIGATLPVLIDRKEGGYWVGRTEFDSPEVDNETLISVKEPLQIGRFYTVTITDAAEFDLYGTLAQEHNTNEVLTIHTGISGNQ
jgi:ribosomal protein S12 methylthiotransferase